MEEKAWLRANTLKLLGKDKVSVLDAYAGEGHVWMRVQELVPDIEIIRLAIEKRKSAAEPGAIIGDNMKVLPTLNLAELDLIDLDAFGFPTEQIRICAERAPDCPVVVTAIANHYAPTPYRVSDSVGIPEHWRNVDGEYPHMLFAKKRWVYWEHYLYTLGYRHATRIHMPDFGYTKRYEVLWSTAAWAKVTPTENQGGLSDGF